MVLCFWSQVEKNEEADQEITQDGPKPEDNVHKAATKIQASFRGHITRKKMKDGEKDEENDAETEEKTERGVSPSEEKPVPTETAEAADSAPSDTPTNEEEQQEAEQPKEAETTAAESPAHDVNAQEKEEEKAKQADVPDAAESPETDQIDKTGASKTFRLQVVCVYTYISTHTRIFLLGGGLTVQRGC